MCDQALRLIMTADNADEIEKIATGDGIGMALEAVSVLSAAIPVLGGPISAVVSGQTSRRKMRRIARVLDRMREQLEGQQGSINDAYVKTEEFEELLEETLLRARNERAETKRVMYAEFLADAAFGTGATYDEQLHFIKTMESLQEAHIEVLKAFMAEPDEDRLDYPVGSAMQTLRRRLPGMPEGRIEDLVRQLNALHLTQTVPLQGMMSGRGAENLSSSITPFGMRFVRFLRT